jgi:general secretion pathway protein E
VTQRERQSSEEALRNARVAKLFQEAELISPTTFKRAMAALGFESKTLSQILQQEVSAETFRDILAEANPFSRKRARKAENLALGQPINITVAEIEDLVARYKQPPQEFLDFLVECGALDNRRADELAARADNDDQLWRVILDERVLSPRTLADLAGSPTNPRSRLLRMQVASDILLHNDIIGPDDIAEVVELCDRLGDKPYEQLHRVISQEDLAERIVDGLFLPSIEMTEESLPPGYADMFPIEMMRRLNFLPLQREESHITLAVPDLLDLALADVLTVATGCMFSLVETSPESLEAVMLAALPDARLRGENLPEIPEDEAGLLLEQSAPLEEERVSETATAIELARRILERAAAAEVTDIHIERLNRGEMRVRYRADGVLHPAMEVPEHLRDSLIARFKVMANMDVTERRRPQDGRFSLEGATAAKERFDFRLSTLPTQTGEKLVIRVLGSSALAIGLDELGLDDIQRDKTNRALDRKHGMILVTGPTGSGKTTTLYTMLSRLNSIERNIIAIEDPVEYKLDGVAQVQVDPHVELNFANGLRAALRQDPDIIMVGEIRDAETGRIAVRAALTGHLVFSTLHTNSSVGAVSSMRYLGVQSYLIASSAVLIAAQRLVRRVCPFCRELFRPGPGLLRDFGLDEAFPGLFARGKGCARCYQTGMKSRTGIFEMLEISEPLRRAIIEERDEIALRDVARDSGGFATLKEASIKKVVEGAVPAAEALKECFLDT